MLALAGTFALSDWAVVAAVLAATTIVGWVAGRRGSIREYFLAGRTLPWWAVSGSIVATEISALTLVAVPAIVFKPGGSFAYLQIAVIGNVLARLFVAWWLVPAWFEREIYSPYDYVEAKLGVRARRMVSAVFAFGNVLSQGVRLYLTALVLEVLIHDELTKIAARTHLSTLALSVGAIGGFAVLWTWIGGMASVVWTDVVLFLVFTFAAAIALWSACTGLDTGFARLVQIGIDTHRFDVFDLDRNPATAYTLWAGVLAASWGGIGAYGMDQMMAQRVFCCANVRAARKALVASSISIVVTVLVAFVGVGLAAYYERHPLEGDALALYRENQERILPIFVVQNVASPWKGVIVAGIFAAAISTLAGVLTALSQTALANLHTRRVSEGADERGRVLLARVWVLVAGLALCACALAMKRAAGRFPSVLDLGLAMAGLTQGALLASFFLAWLPRRIDGSGFLWSAPLSIVFVFALAWSGSGGSAVRACDLAGGALVVAWVVFRVLPGRADASRGVELLVQSAWLLLGVVAASWCARHALFWVPATRHAAPELLLKPLAFPWYVPAGSVVAFVFGHLLSRRAARVEAALPALRAN